MKTQAILDVVETVRRLRAPDGCPWDQAQTHLTLRPFVIEEAYEVLAVLDQILNDEQVNEPKISAQLKEELGDLLMQVLLHSQMTSEKSAFDFFDVAQTLNDKLIRRHPHVFGDKKANSVDAALVNWEKEKQKEKAPHESILDAVPKGMPALPRTTRVIEKVTKVGFQWPDLQGPLAKLDEEMGELKEEIKDVKGKLAPLDPRRARIEAELGDLLFSVCNVAHMLGVSPEDGLRSTLTRFERRFKHVESSLKSIDKLPEQSTLEEMDEFWNQAKVLEKVRIIGLTGGAASGKSTVRDLFRAEGFETLDADQVVRELSAPGGEAYDKIKKYFKTDNKKEIRDRVFGSEVDRKALESILHPLVRMKMVEHATELASKSRDGEARPTLVYEASLLVETGRYKDCEILITVSAEPEEQIARLMKRDGLNPGQAKAMLKSQASNTEREKVASHVITNRGTLEDLKEQTLVLISKLK
ncbi:MAG: nucleoside triphosphate pyrophosphohydrolase [Xanthomonadaceae bacterium]|nr:nucleoside triphosphate pyrophosphohydrolase [Xanthomonadaceae bacterium]